MKKTIKLRMVSNVILISFIFLTLLPAILDANKTCEQFVAAVDVIKKHYVKYMYSEKNEISISEVEKELVKK